MPKPPAPPLPLEDLIFPHPIGNWPWAWGWWLLITVGTVLLISVIVWQYKRYQHAQHLRSALEDLQQRITGLTGAALAQAMNTWLKIQLHPRAPHALTLHGDAWADFLQNSTAQPIFEASFIEALSVGLYHPPTTEHNHLTPELCLHRAQQWLHALPKKRGRYA